MDNYESRAEQSRNITIDFIRGIAIILVVLGHNIQFGSGNTFYQTEGYYTDFLFKLVYSFHMPLFALLSGYLFFWSMKKPTKQIVKKRLPSLLLPIIAWVTLECAGRAAINIIRHDFTVVEFAHTYVVKFLGSFWFLWAMLFCSLIVLLVEKAFKGKVWIYGVLIIPMLFVSSKFNAHLYVYMYPYFAAGFLFNKCEGIKYYRRVAKKDWYALAVAIVTFAVLFIFYGHDSYIYTTKISLLGEKGLIVQLGIDIYRWVIGFAGSIMVIVLCKMICDGWKGKVIERIAYFGKISLGIYILNSYVNMFLLKVTKNFSPNSLIWIIETVVSIIVYVIAVEILKRIPVAKEFFLGGR